MRSVNLSCITAEVTLIIAFAIIFMFYCSGGSAEVAVFITVVIICVGNRSCCVAYVTFVVARIIVIVGSYASLFAEVAIGIAGVIV